MRRAHGFTLIEMVVVMLIISGGMLGITSLFSNTAKSLSTNETLQQATQYAQECAERVMATRRNLGFDWFATNKIDAATQTSCSTNPSGFTRTVKLNPLFTATPNYYTGTGSTACPNGTNCRDVSITVTSTANASLTSAITLLLVYY